MSDQEQLDRINIDKLPLWTQSEMLSAIFAGIVIGLAIGLIF